MEEEERTTTTTTSTRAPAPKHHRQNIARGHFHAIIMFFVVLFTLADSAVDVPTLRCIVGKTRRIGEAEVPGPPWATDFDDADGGFYFESLDESNFTGAVESAAVSADVAQVSHRCELSEQQLAKIQASKKAAEERKLTRLAAERAQAALEAAKERQSCFIATGKYEGTKDGYLFKTGDQGLGYYRGTGFTIRLDAAIPLVAWVTVSLVA